MQTSINITSADTNNKKTTKSLSNINPNIDNEKLKQTAILFTAISNTSYQSANRITVQDIEEPFTPTITKTEPTLTVGEFNYDGYNYTATITYNGDGDLFANSAGNFCRVENNTLTVKTSSGSTFSGTLYASEGTNYAAKSINFERTA